MSSEAVNSNFRIERAHIADACASLWIDGELVHLEDLVLDDRTRSMKGAILGRPWSPLPVGLDAGCAPEILRIFSYFFR
ncbi:hypothetical protein GFL15_12365 [Rhizobium leguminosarum bv. viciae]|nr:hypothetical protein [Rhizobium leguminosarum bv. viciae]